MADHGLSTHPRDFAVEWSAYTPVVTYTNRRGVELTLEGRTSGPRSKLHLVVPSGSLCGRPASDLPDREEWRGGICADCISEALS